MKNFSDLEYTKYNNKKINKKNKILITKNIFACLVVEVIIYTFIYTS